jgi:hypothetical protein
MKTVFLLVWLGTLEALRWGSLFPTKEQHHLVSCVTEIVCQHFIPNQPVVVSSTGNEDDLLNFLLKNIQLSHWPLQVSYPGSSLAENPGQYYDKIGNYVILIRNKNDIEEQAGHLIHGARWNNHARLLTVVTLHEDNPQEQALSVMQELWENMKVLNMVVLVQSEGEFHLYTWFPYQSNTQCLDITDTVLLNKWISQNGGEFSKHETLFPYKIPNNFKGCLIKLVVPYHGTFEVEYFYEFLNGLNFTVKIDEKEWEINPNIEEAITKAIEDVLFGMAEIAFGGIPLLKEASDVADPSLSYYQTQYMWYVPCAKPLPRLEAISHIFSVTVWVTLIAFMFLTAAIMWCLAHMTLESHTYKTASSVFYNIWAVVMGVSVTRMPRTLHLRVVIFPWICYCFAISTIFQIFFTSYLVDPGLEKQITSLQEVLDSKIEFGFRPEMTIYYEQSPYEIHKELLKHHTYCRQTHLCINKVIETGSFATIVESWAADKHLQSVNDSDRELVCRMNENDSFPIRIVSYFSKSSFLLDTFNKRLASITESGLNIRADKERKIRSTFNKLDINDTGGGYFVFTITHLLIAFYTLLIGYILSSNVLICEILYVKFARKPNNLGTPVFGE